MRQLAVFLVLRAVLAGVLESYVLLDRLTAMREERARQLQASGTPMDVRLYPVFDETLSPRNMILLCKRMQVPST